MDFPYFEVYYRLDHVNEGSGRLKFTEYLLFLLKYCLSAYLSHLVKFPSH